MNTAALAALAALAPGDVTAVIYEGLAALPAFNPDHDGESLPEGPAQLRQEIGRPHCIPGDAIKPCAVVIGTGYNPGSIIEHG